MKVFYHDDLDGQCAAWCVAKAFTISRTDLKSMHHDGKDFPLHTIKPDEAVYILDYSIPPETMTKLLAITKNVTWIDHHKTAIDTYKGFKPMIPGLRVDGIAGCELTYVYLFLDGDVERRKSAPAHVQYIGDRDVWKFDFGNDTKEFCAGASLMDTHPLSSAWDTMEHHPRAVMADGKIVRKYQKKSNEDTLKRFGYKATFRGHKAIICNSSVFTSELFGSEGDAYDIMVVYAFDGEKYSVSMYSENENVSAIAKHYGGGGHAKAAGFSCKELPSELRKGKRVK